MNLFEIKNDVITYSNEALMLKPFRLLWDRDKSKTKSIAMAELSALFFYADYKSDFSDLLDEEEKLKQIISYVVGMPEDWTPDEDFNKAVEFYKERSKTISTKLLEDGRIGVNKVSDYIRNVDLQSTDKIGRLKFNAKQYGEVIKSLDEMTEALDKLDKRVKKEQMEKKSSSGSRNFNLFEDGII